MDFTISFIFVVNNTGLEAKCGVTCGSISGLASFFFLIRNHETSGFNKKKYKKTYHMNARKKTIITHQHHSNHFGEFMRRQKAANKIRRLFVLSQLPNRNNAML